MAPASDLLNDEKSVTARNQAAKGDAAEEGVTEAAKTKVIHFVEDGFTALENVWYKGQELEIEIDSELWSSTCDRDGQNSWMLLDEHTQIMRYGKVMFREGAWPYDEYEEEQAAIKERARKRRPPIAKPGFIK